METFGLPIGTEHDRVMALRAALREIADRPYPVWVGGRARHVGLVAAEGAKGWNRWGLDPEAFAVEAAEVASLVRSLNPDPDSFTTSWGGLVALDHDDDAARARPNGWTPGPAPSWAARASSRRRWPATATPVPSGSSSARSTPRTRTTRPASARALLAVALSPRVRGRGDPVPRRLRGATRTLSTSRSGTGHAHRLSCRRPHSGVDKCTKVDVERHQRTLG